MVSACPTCTVALKQDFIATLISVGRIGDLPAARQLAGKAVDFSTLASQLVEQGRLKFKEGVDADASSPITTPAISSARCGPRKPRASLCSRQDTNWWRWRRAICAAAWAAPTR